MTDDPQFSNLLLGYMDAHTLILVAALMWIGHNIPWHVIPLLVEPAGKKPLKRLVAYTYGVLVILIGVADEMLSRQQLGLPEVITLNILVLIVLAAAAGTIAPRLFEWLLDLIVEAHDRMGKRDGRP